MVICSTFGGHRVIPVGACENLNASAIRSVMTTPVEDGIAKKAALWVWDRATRMYTYGKCVITLEKRVTALEQALQDCPADACEYCGKRAMRKTKEGPLLGNDFNKSREDVWTCQLCLKETNRVVRFR
jgi:hypothetical protein